MGKPTGFMEYARTEAPGRDVVQRALDYHEFHGVFAPDSLTRQAARCMDCGVPFCNAGMVLEGESVGCPLGNPIPEINDLVYRGCYEDAWTRLRRTHPFPEFTGRVCPALCEGSCTLGEHEKPVAIREIEHFLDAHTAGRSIREPKIPQRRSSRKVAIVGSGPAGLAAADILNQLGENATVFERDDRPGGLLTYGIPTMKLDKKLVADRVGHLKAEGVVFCCNSNIGIDMPVDDLLRDFDAVILAIGATVARELHVPGAQSQGVAYAMDYLRSSLKQQLDATPVNELLDASGKDVVIIGGGDTGTDCVATALRQGAASITQFQINVAPPVNRSSDNPWPLWPKTLRTDYGHEECIARFGKDPRVFGRSVKAIHADAHGRVKAVETAAYDSVRIAGKRHSKEIPGSVEVMDAQLVLVAMGFSGSERLLIDELDLATGARGNIACAQGSHMSSRRGVFAAGDARRGQSLVVWAIKEGRDAALECHAYLNDREIQGLAG